MSSARPITDIAARIAAACRLIEGSPSLPPLAALAQAAHLSPTHFHRQFKLITGLTPKAYADAHRAGRLRQQLAEGSTVTDAIYASGFDSSTAFYDKSTQLLGMPATGAAA